MTFKGWPRRSLAFYAGLEADNSKTYWQAHKSTYDDDVKAPFAALATAVESEFGALHLFRPNRDVRFSKDKSPYKTAQGAVTEGPGGTSYYLQISSEGLFVGSGYYILAPDQLERYREAVADNRRGGSLGRAVDALRGDGYDIDAHEVLKRAPRGYPPDHPRVELLRYKGLIASRSFGAPRWLHTKAALDRVTDCWRGAAALHRWLDRHVGPSTVAPPEPD